MKALLEEAWDDAAGSTVAALSLSNTEITSFLVSSVASASSWSRRLQVSPALCSAPIRDYSSDHPLLYVIVIAIVVAIDCGLFFSAAVSVAVSVRSTVTVRNCAVIPLCFHHFIGCRL